MTSHIAQWLSGITLASVVAGALTLLKVITDVRKEVRGTKDYLLKERADERAAYELALKTMASYASELKEPIKKALSDPEYLGLYDDIEKDRRTTSRDLKLYPKLLEEIAIPLRLGLVPRHYLFDLIGENVLVCKKSELLWENQTERDKQDSRSWWRLFDYLAHEMEQERIAREAKSSPAKITLASRAAR